MATLTVPVRGMTCAACQARVQRSLDRAPGVQAAAVNLLLNSATITFDQGATSPEAIVQAIRDSGYDAELVAPGLAAGRSLVLPLASHFDHYHVTYCLINGRTNYNFDTNNSSVGNYTC